MSLRDDVAACFTDRYGEPPRFLVRAPGRVNLIGEHTDYNDGFVLPMAIDRDTWIALRPRDDGAVRLYSMLHEEEAALALADLRHGEGWPEYPAGVAWALQEAGNALAGWEGVTGCDVPLGAGLSSSAAFELAVARSFAAVSDLAWDAPAIARLCQRAENRWVGVNCGIMDQMISAVGRAGRAVLIDCRSLECEAVPLPPGTAVVVLDTATRRGLVDSAYNERRAQCEEAARAFGVPALRDVSPAAFTERSAALAPTTRRRARHIVFENERTLEAAAAMRAGDAQRLGALMDASHASLRDDFEVSSRELDLMVDAAQRIEGCLGARMTGAGFGGCAVALVEADAAESFSRRVAADYAAAAGRELSIHICRAAGGAELVRPEPARSRP
ncbi:MAG: galactokinase [Planctomycetota bacterium]